MRKSLNYEKNVEKIEIIKNFKVLNMLNQNVNSSECVICGYTLELTSNIEVGEIIECRDCGTELEVSSITPLMLIEAPVEGEDWGE
jgi:alpha-aminoadipate carrier protein LysW